MLPEDKVGEFQIKAKLGEGCMGVVYLAHQQSLDREVALKFLTPQAMGGATFVHRFYREAKAVAKLAHPNIIQIYTIGEHQGRPYFTMEYVKGVDLARLLKRGPAFSQEESIEIVRSVTKALGAGDEHGIIHRDIKPANLMLTVSGLVKVTDFGLVKGQEGDSKLTLEGQILGTPSYMPPEQGLSRPTDIRSDLYSLGCIFYELLTGQPPFQAANAPEVIYKHIYETPCDPVGTQGPVPGVIKLICLRLLAKKPEDRYQRPAELLKDLASLAVNSAAAEVTLADRVRAALDSVPTPHLADPLTPKASGTMTVIYTQQATLVEPMPFQKAAEAAPATPRPGTQRFGSKSGFPAIRADVQNQEIEIRLPAESAVAPLSPPPPPVTFGGRPASQRQNSGARGTPASTDSPNVALTSAARPASGRLFTAVRPPSSTHLLATSVRPPSGLLPPPAPPSNRLPSSAQLPVASPIASFSLQRYGLSDFREKLDGWGYNSKQGHCPHAAGIAAQALPGKDLFVGSLGDCPLCEHWTRAQGCILPTLLKLGQTSRNSGLALLEEQAEVLCAHGLFATAGALIETYVKQHPSEASAYRALARIYDHPGYNGEDRRRAIVLYHRFLQLEAESGAQDALGTRLIRERLEAIESGRASSQRISRAASVRQAADRQDFRCFYRGDGAPYFGFGMLTLEHLCVAKAGDLDPESGVTAAEIFSSAKRATAFLRHIISGKSSGEQKDTVLKELERLKAASTSALRHASTQTVIVDLDHLTEVEVLRKPEAETLHVLLRAGPRTHELVFTKNYFIEAERAALLIRRVTGK